MFLCFNTGIIDKAKIINDRKKIVMKYIKNNLIVDIISTFPLLVLFFNIPIGNQTSEVIVILNFFKLFMIQDRIERLAFYFSFEKNYKNLVQLIKLIIIILFITHFFACFWHGLGLVEIYYLKRTDTWIHAKNLVNSQIYIKYTYSIYFLAATMITVGYGDITP